MQYIWQLTVDQKKSPYAAVVRIPLLALKLPICKGRELNNVMGKFAEGVAQLQSPLSRRKFAHQV